MDRVQNLFRRERKPTYRDLMEVQARMKACNRWQRGSEPLFGHRPLQLAEFVTRHPYPGARRIAELTKLTPSAAFHKSTVISISHPPTHRVNTEQGITLIGFGWGGQSYLGWPATGTLHSFPASSHPAGLAVLLGLFLTSLSFVSSGWPTKPGSQSVIIEYGVWWPTKRITVHSIYY